MSIYTLKNGKLVPKASETDTTDNVNKGAEQLEAENAQLFTTIKQLEAEKAKVIEQLEQASKEIAELKAELAELKKANETAKAPPKTASKAKAKTTPAKKQNLTI